MASLQTNLAKKSIFNFNFPKGISLIEANAGTGKTFSLEVLYLKALVELKLKVSQILLVTFTVEVTIQMKKRLYDTLKQVCNYLQDKETNSLEPLLPLLKQFKNNPEAKNLLQRALVSFDEIAIFSIHGFAALLTQEFFIRAELSSSSQLVTELEEDLAPKMIHSFYLNCILGESDYNHFCYSLIDDSEKKKMKAFFCDLAAKLDFVDLLGIPNFDKPTADSYSKSYYLKLKKSYDDLLADFQTDNILNFHETTKQHHRKQIKTLTKHSEALQLIIKDKKIFTSNSKEVGYLLGWYDEMKEQGFSCSALETLQAYCKMQEEFIACLRKDFLDFARHTFIKYKQENKVYCFDDLISAFYKLSKNISFDKSNRFKLIMIDEFQDTDWLQSQSFLNLFYNKQNDFDIRIILVGDPKQSIFRFRGGDIFSYLKMKKEFVNESSYRLDCNWRSQEKIVEAVNLLFADKNSFYFKDIDYFPSSAVLKLEDGAFIDSQPQPAVTLWDYQDTADLTVPAIEEKILTHLAGTINKMLQEGQQSRFKIGNTNLEPAMICILVPKNEHISKVRKYLARFGIYASSIIRANLLESEEFWECWDLWQAIYDYQNEKLLSTVLLSNFFDYSLAELQAKKENDLATLQTTFQNYNKLWNESGFAVMLEKLIREQGIIKKLLQKDYRSVANFYQSLDWFLDFLQPSISIEKDLQKLKEYFEKGDFNQASERDDLNIESDKNLVRIMTIHKSKGLEFPIVFCPYLWKGDSTNVNSKLSDFFHLKENNTSQSLLSYNIGLKNSYQQEIENEKKAETRRLLYVMLTRAKHQIYLYHSSSYFINKGSKKSFAFAELLETLKANNSFEDWLKIVNYQKLPLEITSSKTLSLSPQKLHTPKEWQGNLKLNKKSYSFTSLKSSAKTKDSSVKIPEKFESNLDLQNLSFAERVALLPSNMNMGNLLHQALEFWQPQLVSKQDLTLFVKEKLLFLQFEKEWLETIVELCLLSSKYELKVENLNFRLNEMTEKNSIREMGFNLSLSKNELQKKVELAYKKNPENKVLQSSLEFLLNSNLQEINSICNGFIDLIFVFKNKYYILDWKTNWLGNNAQDYNSTAIINVMQKYNYFLQYLLYYLALEKFLKSQKFIKQASIGGVIYLFVRGLSDTNKSLGVYFDNLDYFKFY